MIFVLISKILFVELMDLTIRMNVFVDARERARNTQQESAPLKSLAPAVREFWSQFALREESPMTTFVIWNAQEMN